MRVALFGTFHVSTHSGESLKQPITVRFLARAGLVYRHRQYAVKLDFVMLEDYSLTRFSFHSAFFHFPLKLTVG